MAVAVFDYAAWAALYPELAATVNEARATALFGQAGLFLNNTDCSPVTDVSQRQQLLYMIVAHLAALGGALNGGATAGIPGRMAEATEGTVRIKFDTGAVSGSEAWWAQTSYGWAYWAAMAPFRTMQYVPGPPQIVDPWPFGFGYGYRGW